MICRTLTRVLLLWLVVGLAAPALADTWGSAGGEEDCHSGGSPCPDPEGGDPCGPACPCACCPGHRAAPALATGSSTAAVGDAGRFEAGPPEGLHPKDVVRRVFHPPRG